MFGSYDTTNRRGEGRGVHQIVDLESDGVASLELEHSLTFVQQLQGGIVWSIEMLEEERFAIDSVDRDVFSADAWGSSIEDGAQASLDMDAREVGSRRFRAKLDSREPVNRSWDIEIERVRAIQTMRSFPPLFVLR